MATIINLFGSPGAGKSTTAAFLFALMKLEGFNVELVTEYAKDLVWEDREATLSNQIYVFGKQHHRLFRVKQKVDYIITDSPLGLSEFYNQMYGNGSLNFRGLVLEEISKDENINVFINRTKAYNPIGRYQTEAQSDEFSVLIKQMLIDLDQPFEEIEGTENAAMTLLKKVKELRGDKEEESKKPQIDILYNEIMHRIEHLEGSNDIDDKARISELTNIICRVQQILLDNIK